MNPKYLLEAMNDIDYTMVEEAENMMNRQKNRMPRGNKTVLIAAALLVLLCITAAAAGILWGTPEVIVGEDTQTLLLNNGYLTLPEESVQTLLAIHDPERVGIFQTFDGVREWQEFFSIPFVSSTALTVDDEVQSAVTASETDGEVTLHLLMSHLNVERYREGTEDWLWRGMLTVLSPLNQEAAKDGSWTRELSEKMNAEILAEDTTAAGVPYVISKITHDSDAEFCNLLLYYGHEAVLYELEVSACVGQEEAMIFEDLVNVAETLQIMPNN